MRASSLILRFRHPPTPKTGRWLRLGLGLALVSGLGACAEVKLPRLSTIGNLLNDPITLLRPPKPAPAQTSATAPPPVAAAPAVIPSPTPPAAAAPSAPVAAPGPVTDPIVPVPLPADGTVRIGFLAPLTSPQAELGQALVNAATLALFDFGNPKIILMPQDAGETDAQGRLAAQAAIAAGARLLIGPVFAKSVAGAAEIAHAAHINLIAFSSDRSVASPGAWITGFLPEEDVKRILTFANQKGLRQIAALVPESPYGARIKESLNRVVPELQGELVAVESFVEQPTAASEPMRRMAVAQGRPQGANLGDPSWTPRYQAVMLAEGGAMLTSMAALLPYYEIDTQRIRVLGTGLWDDSRISREPTLVGGWFAAADLGPRREFNDRYSRTFGKAPPRIATLAYDAVALAAVLAQVDGGDPYSTERLTQSQGFAGIDGIFRLKPDGTSERGLAVIEVQRDGFKVIDPAPTAFPVPAAQGAVPPPSM